MRTVAAIPAAGLLTGATAGFLLADSTWHPAWLAPYGGEAASAAAGPAVLLLSCVVVAAVAFAARRTRALAAAIVLGFFLGGAVLAASAWQRAWRPPLRIVFEEMARDQRRQAEAEGRRLPEDDEAFATIEGVLRADATPTESGVSLSVDVEVCGVACRAEAPEARRRSGIAVTVVGSLAASNLGEWRAGRRVRMPVVLRRPSRYLDPGVPDHERALARRSITLVGTVKSGALVDLVERGSVVDETIGAVRAFARRAIASSVGRWSPQSAAIVAAIVIGDRAGLDDRVQQRLQEAGTYHVIAISGGNIAILAGVLVGVFRMGGWLGRTAMLSAIVLLAAYARLAGGGASVDRATLMAAVHFGARAFDQRTPPLNTLAVVAAVLVAADPLAVADPAFLLTFGATLGILLISPVVVPVPAHPEPADQPSRFALRRSAVALANGEGRATRSWFDKLTTSGRCLAALAIALLASSAAAEVLLLPIAAFFFSRITFAGLFLNFLAIPLMAVAQLAGMLLVPIAVVSPAASALVGWVAHLGAAGLVRSADLVRLTPLLS